MSFVAATYNSPVDFNIPPNPPPGLPPNVQQAFAELYQFSQRVIQTLTNYCGIGPQDISEWGQLAGSTSTILRNNLGRFYVTASENIAFGACINLFSNAGTVNVRNANATNNTKPCDGYCSTVGGMLAGTVGEVILGPGVNTIVGVAVGVRYWLAISTGTVQASAPVAAGNIEQYLGVGIAPGQLYFTPHYWIQH